VRSLPIVIELTLQDTPTMSDIQPFKIAVPEAKIDRLKQQLALADFPDEVIDEKPWALHLQTSNAFPTTGPPVTTGAKPKPN
jgi:hypothetical protein